MNFRIGSRITQAQAVGSLSDPIPEFGGLVISDTALHSPDENGTRQYGWSQLYVLTDAVLDAATVCNISGIAGVTLKQGALIRGIFSQIKLTSGSVIAHYATEQ